jgi:hypothetical protein
MTAITDLTVEADRAVEDTERKPCDAVRSWQCECGQVYRTPRENTGTAGGPP